MTDSHFGWLDAPATHTVARAGVSAGVVDFGMGATPVSSRAAEGGVEAIAHTDEADGCAIATIRLDGPRTVVDEAAALLSAAEHDRADRFAFDIDRNRYIVARVGLRRFLADRLNVAPAAIELTYGLHGKPTLAGSFARSGLQFNVSHSGGVAAYAFASGRAVGIDVERVRPLPNARAIASRFFSSTENAVLRTLDPRELPAAFLRCWTRKEAFIKAVGDGLRYALDRFDVTLAPGQPARLIQVDGVPGDRCGWELREFTPGAGMIGAYVVQDSASLHRVNGMPWMDGRALDAPRHVRGISHEYNEQ